MQYYNGYSIKVAKHRIIMFRKYGQEESADKSKKQNKKTYMALVKFLLFFTVDNLF